MPRINAQPHRFISNAGVIEQPTWSSAWNVDHFDITFSSCLVALHRDPLGISPPEVFRVPGGTFAVPHDQSTVVCACYLNGVPQLNLAGSLQSADPNFITHFPIGQVFEYHPEGWPMPFVDYIPYDNPGFAGASKMMSRIHKTSRLRFGEPPAMTVGELPGHIVTVSGGRGFISLQESLHDPVRSDTAYTVWVYPSGGGTYYNQIVSTYNYQYYANGTGLTAILPNRYTINWIYRVMVEDSNSIIIWIDSRSDLNSFQDAHDAPFPSDVPALITDIAAYAGKLIVLAGAATSSHIESWYDQ